MSNSEVTKPTNPSVADDSAVSVRVSEPTAWNLQELNVAIGGVNDASCVISKIGDLLKSLEGFHQQLTSPAATPRQAALLQTEAAAVSAELHRAAHDEALNPFGHIDLSPSENAALPNQKELARVHSEQERIKHSIDDKRLALNRELARLETAHLNSESSHTAIRDIESALALVQNTRRTVLEKPTHAVEACGALGLRAKALLLNS